MKAKAKPDPLPHYYICHACATEKGAAADECGGVTVHRDVCPYCKQQDWLAAITDYNWPKLKRKAVFD